MQDVKTENKEFTPGVRAALVSVVTRDRTEEEAKASLEELRRLLETAGGEAAGLGSVGCTSTRASYQGRGIATNMVKAGLLNKPLTRSFQHV